MPLESFYSWLESEEDKSGRSELWAKELSRKFSSHVLEQERECG